MPSKPQGISHRACSSLNVLSQCHFRGFSVPEGADGICPCSVSQGSIFLAYPDPTPLSWSFLPTLVSSSLMVSMFSVIPSGHVLKDKSIKKDSPRIDPYSLPLPWTSRQNRTH